MTLPHDSWRRCLAVILLGACGLLTPSAALATGGGDRWAVIDVVGTFIRSKGAVSAEVLGKGSYAVSFDKSVRTCAYLVTIAAADAEPPDFGEIGAKSRGKSTPNHVLVSTRKSNGKSSDRPFQLYVKC